MKNLVLYAPPAAGKGTLCEYLKEKHGYKHISTGDLLRAEIKKGTDFGKEIDEIISTGALVSDEIITKLLKNAMEELNGALFILDGYPRNIDQAKELDTLLENYIVINLDIDRELAMKRTLGRVNCKECGRIYNIYFDETKPQNEGVCDDCGAVLNARNDDNESSFNVRFDIYEENAPVLLDYYKNKEILYIVDSRKTPEETSSQVERILND